MSNTLQIHKVEINSSNEITVQYIIRTQNTILTTVLSMEPVNIATSPKTKEEIDHLNFMTDLVNNLLYSISLELTDRIIKASKALVVELGEADEQ